MRNLVISKGIMPTTFGCTTALKMPNLFLYTQKKLFAHQFHPLDLNSYPEFIYNLGK